MALGNNRLSDFEPLTARYDLLIAAHSVGADVIQAFRQRSDFGGLVFVQGGGPGVIARM
jgi:hypothetical protein